MSETPQKHAMMRDMVMTWEEISDALIWEAYDVNGPEHQGISAERLEEFCKRFPHFEVRLRSFTDDWNKDPMITQEMLAAIEHTEISQAEIDKSWRQAKRILDFYRKLREVEAQRDKAQAALSAAEQRAEAMGRDAARYRWLREQHEGHAEIELDADGLPMPMEPNALAFTVFMPDPSGDESLITVGCFPGELDAAIDAALAQSTEQTTEKEK